MEKVSIGSFDEFEKYVGKQIGVSDYLKIEQSKINQFADATLDHQWIHTDAERAARESPFKKTIAHGYLALSLVPYLWNQIADIHKQRSPAYALLWQGPGFARLLFLRMFVCLSFLRP